MGLEIGFLFFLPPPPPVFSSLSLSLSLSLSFSVAVACRCLKNVFISLLLLLLLTSLLSRHPADEYKSARGGGEVTRLKESPTNIASVHSVIGCPNARASVKIAIEKRTLRAT